MSSLRQKWISAPAFKLFKKVLPPLSSTEKEAMEAGSVWWDGELFLVSQIFKSFTITQNRRLLLKNSHSWITSWKPCLKCLMTIK